MSCSLNDSPQRARLLADLRERIFSPASPGPGSRIGAEVELLPWDVRLGRPLPILDDERGRGSLGFLAGHAEDHGWSLTAGRHGVPSFTLPGGGHLTFEPGGQIEYAAPPLPSAALLSAHLAQIVPPLRQAAARHGIDLVGRGMDPRTPLDQAGLLLQGDRYTAMHRYLSVIGEAGPRMMLQTAAVQVNVELEPHFQMRWRVLNAAAPYLTALFANSRVYAGRDTGYASYRARQWRLLDRRRTGLLGRGADPAEEYLDFALNACWIFAPPGATPEPFVEWLVRGQVTLDDWGRHLTTLFPEVRPRGYLEIRCIDALPPRWYAAPLVLLEGMLADEATLGQAGEIVGEPDSQLLQDAARVGMSHPLVAGPAVELFRAALSGAERSRRTGAALDTAREYFERYTLQSRSPADEDVDAAA